MFRFMCFPVTVDTKNNVVRSRASDDNGRVFETASYDAAIEQAGNHIPLFEGEQMACVKVGKILDAAASSTLPLTSAGS